jgi:RNA polymerase sigma factor (TIGR02999 family)
MTLPITELLQRVAEGDHDAFGGVFEELYPELRRIAHARLYASGRFAELGTTSLVHESFLRLGQSSRLKLENRRHFFALASKAMRHIVIDELRSAHAGRRGGGAIHVTLADDDELALAAPAAGPQVEALHDALRELDRLDPELAEVADMRWFGGFSETEIAEVQGVTERTVRRRWDKARAFLLSTLGNDPAPPAAPA